jgi:hypothetical protein
MFDILGFILFLAEKVFLFFRDIKGFSILRFVLEISHEDTRYLTLDSILFGHAFQSSSLIGQTEMQ